MRLEMITAKALKRLNNDRYVLAVAVSQRANDLSNGAKPLIDFKGAKNKFTEIAIHEIADGVLEVDSFIDK